MYGDIYAQQYHEARYPELLVEAARRRQANAVTQTGPSTFFRLIDRAGAMLIDVAQRFQRDSVGPVAPASQS
jgi:hypothetical protein